MPPSGPSTSPWSSSISSHNNLAPPIELKNKVTFSDSISSAGSSRSSGSGGPMMNSGIGDTRSFDDDVIGSLGKTLSAVNLSGGGDGSGSVGGNSHGQHGGQAYGSVYGGSHQGRSDVHHGGSSYMNGSSWGGFSSTGSTPTGLSYGLYGSDNGSKIQSSKHEADSLQNILYDSGIYEKDDVAKHSHSATPPPSFDRERKQSIDIFLSQSPSKALGEDAFRVMARTASNPALVSLYHQHDSLPTLKPMSSTAPSSRSESPQGGRLGSLKSDGGGHDSPYGSGVSNRQVSQPQFNRSSSEGGEKFGGYPNFGHDNGQSYGGYGAQLPQSQMTGQFSNSPGSNMSGMGGISNAPSSGTQQQHQFIPVPIQQQQPQVFYMAVPAPDGKGQVLQPVQMVQLPGQPPTLMVPTAIGNVQGHMVSSPTNANQVVNAPAPVMMMQAMSNANNGQSMYGQDNRNDGNGNSNGNQYAPYRADSQAGSYDSHYSSKSVNMDYGGQYNTIQGSDGNIDPLNGALSILYQSPHRPPLRSLLGNVRRLSRDQVGCRLLQQALDEDGPSAATAILNEGLTFWAEAMVDPFGNYLFQKILERITPEERVTLVKSVSTRLVNASLNLHGTRSVQKIVEVCAVDEEENEDSDECEVNEAEAEPEADFDAEKSMNAKKKKKKKETAAKILTDALKPSAARLCIDSHGNHAIQRILLKLPYQYTQFIFDAVAASVEDVARHRHGCCVIQRCLDSRHSAARTHLVSRIVEKSLELMQDAYGNYVVQYVLDVCGDDEVHAICESVVGKVCLLAIQKFSSNVMEKCLERCTDRVREEYLNELNDSDRIRELMMDPFGNYVVQRALSVSTHAQAIRLVETMKPHLSSQNGGGGIRNTAGGRRILGKICRRFPNFVLEGETFEDYDLNQVLQRGSPHSAGGRRPNQFPPGIPQPGHTSPSQRRRSRNHIPQFQGHHVTVQQPEVMSVYHQQAGNNPYLFPHSM